MQKQVLNFLHCMVSISAESEYSCTPVPIWISEYRMMISAIVGYVYSTTSTTCGSWCGFRFAPHTFRSNIIYNITISTNYIIFYTTFSLHMYHMAIYCTYWIFAGLMSSLQTYLKYFFFKCKLSVHSSFKLLLIFAPYLFKRNYWRTNIQMEVRKNTCFYCCISRL